jgi:hypothetical protein
MYVEQHFRIGGNPYIWCNISEKVEIHISGAKLQDRWNS